MPALYMGARNQNLQYHACITPTLQRSNLPSIRIKPWGGETSVYGICIWGGSEFVEGVFLNHPPPYIGSVSLNFLTILASLGSQLAPGTPGMLPQPSKRSDPVLI